MGSTRADPPSPSRDDGRIALDGTLVPSRDRAIDGLAQVDVRRGPLLDLSRHDEEAIDDPGQAIDLEVGRLEALADGLVGRLRDRAFEPELHGGQGRSELVRGVGDELALRLDRALEPVGHLVERLPELLDLPGAAHVAGAGREVAVPQALRGTGQPRERPGEGSGEPEREQQPGRERREPDRAQADGDVADVVVDLLHAPGEPNGAQELFLVLDRNGGRHDVVTEIDAVSDLREGRPLQGPLDLGSSRCCVEGFRRDRAVGVRDEEPSVVDHDHPAVDLLGRLRDEQVQPSRVVDVVDADLRRDPLRLEQRLVRELGRRPSLEVDRERDAQRDDQDDEDVREREDEPGSDLRGRLLGLGIRTEPEAHPADRRDVRRVRGVVLDLLAEPGDVHVERLGRAEPVGIPDLVHDPFAAQHLPGVRHQEVQQVELASRELDRFVVLGDGARGGIETERPDLDRALLISSSGRAA